jgi:hypothetical protein
MRRRGRNGDRDRAGARADVYDARRSIAGALQRGRDDLLCRRTRCHHLPRPPEEREPAETLFVHTEFGSLWARFLRPGKNGAPRVTNS